MYETGSFVAENDDSNKRQKKIAKMRQGSVAGLVAAPHRFDSLVEKAWEFVPKIEHLLRKDKAKVGAGGESSDEDAFMAIDPPTSPI